MMIFTGRQNHNGASANHEAKILTLVRIFWIALIVFLYPKIAASSAVSTVAANVAPIAESLRTECVNAAAEGNDTEKQAQEQDKRICLQAYNKIIPDAARIDRSVESAGRLIGNGSARDVQAADRNTITALNTACRNTGIRSNETTPMISSETESTAAALDALKGRLTSNKHKCQGQAGGPGCAHIGSAANAFRNETVRLQGIDAQLSSFGNTCFQANQRMETINAEQAAAREARQERMQNLQMAQMGVGAVTQAAGLFKKDDKAGGGGGNSSMPDVAPFNMPFDSLADADGDGVPDKDEAPSTSLTATGPTNGVAASAVGFSAASTGNGGQVGASPVGSGFSNASVSDTGAGADFARPEELGSGSAGGGFGSSGGGSSSSSGGAGANTSGASTVATAAGDKAAETPASGETPTNGGGSSLLGMGGDSGGLGDLMGGFKNPFEAAAETPGSGSALIGASQPVGGEAPEAKPERVLASTADNSIAKESLFGRVSDRLSLACERAELRCQKPKRIQGEI